MLAPRDDRGIRRVSAPWAIVIRSFAFVRKEIVEIVRQPRLVLLLVLGPFALLLLFGSGYADTDIRKRAVFVAPADSVYADVLGEYEQELADYVTSEGRVDTETEGRAMLAAGDTDVVVVFPDDPADKILAGERAEIMVYYDEIGPIEQGTIQIAAQLAVQEINSMVLETILSGAQDETAPVSGLGDVLVDGAERFSADPVGGRAALDTALVQVDAALAESITVLDRLGTQGDRVAGLTQLRGEVADVQGRLAASDGDLSDAELEELTGSVRSVAGELNGDVVLDPAVLVRPFQSDTENVLGRFVSATDFYTPAALALLLQHVALTFAALSIVRDRRTGLFELMRVGPLSSGEIILGKVLAYLIVGSVVGAALVVAAVFGLGLEVTGSLWWLAATIIGVLVASLALGMVLALISQSESQAVQFAMLALLAGLFFGGFILPVSGLQYPVRLISWLLPVTYGVQALQDVMLRGDVPADPVLAGLCGIVLVYGSFAIIGLRRRLRTSAA